MDDDQCDLDDLTALLDSDHDELNEDDVQLAAMASEMESKVLLDGNGACQQISSEDACTASIISTAQTDAEMLAELKIMQEKIRLLEARLSQSNPVLEPPLSTSLVIKTSFIQEAVAESKTASKVGMPSLQTNRGGCVSKQAASRVIKDGETDNIFFAKKGVRVAHGSANTGAYGSLDRVQDSDSDWEGLDGEPGSDLSAAGRQINNLLKSKSTYRSHGSDSLQNAVVPPKTSATRTNSLWDEKASVSYTSSLIGMPLPSSSSAVSKHSVPKDPSKDGADIFKEPQSGVRIIKPQVSSERLKTLMEGRRLIRLSILHQKARGSDIDGDWVTIAVIVGKSEPKVSAKGSKYSIWRLSDLGDCDKVVSLFLFAKAHSDLWKTSIGSVIGILNASVMQNLEKYQSSDNNDVSITVDTSQKILFMGQSKDLGSCQGFTKAGKQCTNFVNINLGGYCTYHVQAAYKKCSNKRAELQVTYSGIVPKTAANKKVRGTGSVFYGGKDYSLSERSKPKKSISLESVHQHRSRFLSDNNKQLDGHAPITSVSTFGSCTTYVRSVGEALNMSATSKTLNSSHSATLSSDKSLAWTLFSNKNSALETSAAKISQASLVSRSPSHKSPSAKRASTCTSFEEALSGKSSTEKQVSTFTSSDETLSGKSSVEKQLSTSLSFDESLSVTLSAVKRVTVTSSSDKALPGSLSYEKHSSANADSEKLVTSAHSLVRASSSSAGANAGKPESQDNTLFLDLLTVPTVGARCFMKHLEVQEKVLTGEVKAPSDKTGSKPVARKSSSATSVLKDFEKMMKHKMLAGSSVPKLGRGLAADGESTIDLDDIPQLKSSITDRAKLKAIAKVKSIGGIMRQDPNSVKKSFNSPEVQQKISKRVRASPDEKDTTENVSVGSKDGTLPVKKKSRMLGNVDLNSSEIQKLINAKSSHTALVDEMELERQEEYFNTMEKTEKMENKMDSVREVKCTAFSCSQCKYTALTVGDRCKSEGHHIKTFKAKKRFFRCKECSWRTTSLDKIPTTACSKCGSSNFERTSMLNAKRGPKLPTEKLLLRGEEEKFLR